MDVRLPDDQLEQLADLVAARLTSTGVPTTSRLLNAEELALQLGVSRRYVYDHADELGAVKLGVSRTPRLRFDLEAARNALNSRRDTNVEPAPPHRRTPRRQQSEAGSILKIRGRRP